MTAKGRGGGKTPSRLVKLINEAIKEKSLRSISRESGLGLAPISRFSKGTSEPSFATLQKLSIYFERPVEWLRGEDYVDFWGEVYGDSLTKEQVEHLNDEFWRNQAERSAGAPIMIDIVKCLSKLPSESRTAAYAMFRNMCHYIESLSQEELIKQGEELIKRLNSQCECQTDKDVNQ